MVYSFQHPAVERRATQEMESWRARDQMLRQRATPEMAARVAELARTWPDIPPGVLVGMAMAGIGPGDDIARQVEQRAVERSMGRGFHEPGEVVNSRQIEAEQRQRGGIGGAWDQAFEGLKAGVRGAFMGMETAFEEVSRRATAGLVAVQDPNRTYAEAMELSTPSMGALLATDEFGWEDLGSGFIPAGAVWERQEELKQRLTMDGQWMSPGRALAINVTEPGTRAFNFTSGLIDAAFRIFGDPATYATAGLGKVRMASKAFATDSALIRALRNTTDENFARNWWLGSAPGQRLRSSLVDLDDPYEVWRRLGGPQGKVDRETANLIARARNAEELDSVVLPRLGPQGIAEKPIGSLTGRTLGRVADMVTGDDLGAIHGIGAYVRRGSDRVRMLNWLPDQTIDVSDPDRAMVTIHRFLRGIKASEDESAKVMNLAFRVGDEATPEGWLDVGKQLADLAVDHAIRDSVRLDDLGLAATKRGEKRLQEIKANIERLWSDRQAELTRYFTRESNRPRSHVPTIVDGQDIDYSQVPHLVSEYLGRNIPLPDMQEMRRHIGGYAKAMRIMGDLPRPLVEGAVDFASGFMSSVWKPMVLLRGAYIVRVVGEEQMRMGAAGLDSAFRHPFSFIAYLTGRKGAVGVTGDPIKEMVEFQGIAQRKGGGWIGRKPGSIGTEDWITYQRGSRGLTDDQFARAYADDFSLLVNDPIATRVARDGAEETKAYLASAKGKNLRRQIAEADHNRDVLSSTRALNDYVDTVWMRIEEKTRGNTDLIQAIATGRLDGQIVRNLAAGGNQSTALQKGLRARLDEVGIQEVKGRRYITTSRRGSNDHALLDRYNRAIDIGADIIMSKPTNFMSRFPTWQQEYVRAAESMLGFADAPTQRAIIQWAKREANLSRTQVRRMERTAAAGQGSRITDLEGVDLAAKAIATRNTRKLLYDLTEHGQFSDMVSAAMPFAEAWKEILTSWSRIVRDRPSVVRRGQQVIEGARGSGFFYTDPTTGEETFAYPGGKFVSRALLNGYADNPLMQGALGIPGVGAAATVGLGVAGAFMDEQPAEFDLTGQAAGLNLFAASIIPGLGPVVTLPLAAMMPDVPSWDVARDLLFPFGEPDTEGGIAGAFLPAWMQRFRTAWFQDPDNHRTYANSVFDVARALLATGEYSTDTPEENARLLAVAKQRAKGLWMVRGASQFVAPTGPAPRFRVQDLEGEWWPFQVVASEFHRLRQEHGEQEAVDEFLATFGSDLITLLQSKSRQVVDRPASQVGDDWLRANPEVVERYPLTAGLVAPDDPTGEFSFQAYHRQFEEGAREQLTPQQMLWLSNNMLGRLAYAHAVEQIGDGNDEFSRRARAQVRAQLTERFPGFNAHLGVTMRPRVEDQIAELQAMANDERLADNPAVRGLRQYLAAREQAQQMVERFASRSQSFARSNETRWIRQWLRSQAEQITQRHPEFIPLWERALSRELAEDDDPIEPGQVMPSG